MKTFVFDLDGVICVGASFSQALEKEYNIPHERLRPFFKTVFPDCIIDRRDLKEVLTPYLDAWGWPESIDQLLAFWFQREHVLCPEILNCARALRKKGHLCALGTNQEKYRTAYLRSEMRLLKEFDHIFPSCELGAAKPSAAFFKSIERQLQQSADQLCLIDDAATNIAGAQSAGWSTVLYRGTHDISRIIEMSSSSRGAGPSSEFSNVEI